MVIPSITDRMGQYWRDRRQNWLKGIGHWAQRCHNWHQLAQGGGGREIARRRRQIERGQLTTSNGLVREPSA